MSEWKNKIKNHATTPEEAAYCTGWGIIDGILNSISAIRQKKQSKKSKN